MLEASRGDGSYPAQHDHVEWFANDYGEELDVFATLKPRPNRSSRSPFDLAESPRVMNEVHLVDADIAYSVAIKMLCCLDHLRGQAP